MHIQSLAKKVLTLTSITIITLAFSMNSAFAGPTQVPAGGTTPSASTTPQPTGIKAASESFNVGKYMMVKGQKKVTGVDEYLVRAINLLSLLIGSVTFLCIVIGAMLLLTSGGRQQAIDKGKDTIKFAIIGLCIALVAYFITAQVLSIFYEYAQ